LGKRFAVNLFSREKIYLYEREMYVNLGKIPHLWGRGKRWIQIEGSAEHNGGPSQRKVKDPNHCIRRKMGLEEEEARKNYELNCRGRRSH